MFGRVRRKSSNIRAMQLFHELKQQFPTLPDHVVSACIANHAHLSSNDNDLRETLEDAVTQQEEPMGRTLPEVSETALPLSNESGCNNSLPNKEKLKQRKLINRNKPKEASNEPKEADPEIERSIRPEMNEGVSESNVLSSSVRYSKQTDSVDTCAGVEQHVGNSSFYVKRPNTLNLPSVSDRSFTNIQPSGRCSDVHKLLNSEIVNNKPPRSPLSAKRFGNPKTSPTKPEPNSIRSPSASPENNRKFSQDIEDPKQIKKTETKRETADTPTQTTDTLLGGGTVNLSLNVKLDVVQSPTKPKCTSSLQVVPQQPWCEDFVSPRSYTSVNLTLRPPSSEPQPPIDITSKNSSLTYSTSSFDPQKGLQSRLQITVGPSGGGVASMRTRPRSSYHPDSDMQDVAPARVGSLPDLAAKNPQVERQQIRLERLKIELRTEKVKLVAEQREIAALENYQNNSQVRRQNEEIEKQLQKDINDLRAQCDQLTCEIDRYGVPLGETREVFYNNLYRAQRPSSLGFPEQIASPNPPVHSREPRCQQQTHPNLEYEGPKWNCHLCTFQNHPLLDKCEQCEMPRILHGKKSDSNLPLVQNDNSNFKHPFSRYAIRRPLTTQNSNLASNVQNSSIPNLYTNRQFSSPPAFERNSSLINGLPSVTRASLDSTNQRNPSYINRNGMLYTNSNISPYIPNGISNELSNGNFVPKRFQ